MDSRAKGWRDSQQPGWQLEEGGEVNGERWWLSRPWTCDGRTHLLGSYRQRFYSKEEREAKVTTGARRDQYPTQWFLLVVCDWSAIVGCGSRPLSSHDPKSWAMAVVLVLRGARSSRTLTVVRGVGDDIYKCPRQP